MFHLPTDKYTIMLEDMSILLGFRINDKVVNGLTRVSNDIYIYFENLGIKPEEKMGLL